MVHVQQSVVAAIMVAGCSVAQPALQDPVFATATPESQGVSSEALAALSQAVTGFLERDYAVGAELLVIKNRAIIFHEAYGNVDRELQTPWAIGTGEGTVCNIRSMTKTLTGAAAQILIDRGQLALDDPAARYLPGFDNDKSRAITVRHLLTHRSGAWGSQTMYSTALDYAKFLGMWMDGGLAPGGARVLSEAAVARTLTPASPMSMLGSDARLPTDFRGLHTYYGQMSVLYCPKPEPRLGAEDADALPTQAVIISHSGSDGTIAWAWPDLDLMVLYFTQSRGGASPLRLEEAIDRLLIHPGEDGVIAGIPEELEPLVGVYIANFASYENERFEVLVKNGSLALDIPSQMVFDLLAPDSGGLWAFAFAPDLAQVSFQLGEDGNAEMLRIHQSGMTFEVPREGTPLAAEQSREVEIAPDVLQSIVGAYRDPESDTVLEVFLDPGGVLSIKAPSSTVFQLRAARDAELTWIVKQNPAVSLSFQRGEDGTIVSMTRHIGDATVVMPRQDP